MANEEIIYTKPMGSVQTGDWELLKNLGNNKAVMGGLIGVAGTAAAAALWSAIRGKGSGIDNIANVISNVIGGATVAPALAAFTNAGHGAGNVPMSAVIQENTMLKAERYTDAATMMLDRRICALETKEAINSNDTMWFRKYANNEYIHQPKVCMTGGVIPYQPSSCCCCNTGESNPTV